MSRHRRFVFALTALLAACAANGPRFADLRPEAAPVSADAARLIVFRGGQLQYVGRAAAIVLDGADRARLAANGFVSFDVSPGRHRISVDMWDAPGRCEQVLELVAGSVAYLEVAPREGSFFSGVPGNMMAGAGPQGGVAGLGVMLGGMALESSGKGCGGAFSITPVDRDRALPALAELRSSH